MKKGIITILLHFMVCVAWAQHQKVEPQIPFYSTLEDSNSFSIIMIPDPQSYVKFEANQPLFKLQTAWVVQMMFNSQIADGG